MSGSQGYLAWGFVHVMLWSSADFIAGIVLFVFSFLPDSAFGLSVPSFPSCCCFPGFSLSYPYVQESFLSMFYHFNFCPYFYNLGSFCSSPSLYWDQPYWQIILANQEKSTQHLFSLSLPSVLWQFLQSRYAAFCDSESSIWLPFTWASEGFLLISVLFSS